MKTDVVSAYGQWFGDVIVAIAAIFAIYQLALGKKGSEADAFITICDLVEESEFLRNYEYVRSKEELLATQSVADKGLEALAARADYERLCEACFDVLFQLEKAGVLVRYAIVNERMVTDYIGDVVVNSYAPLSKFIEYSQRDDKKMWENFVDLQRRCVKNGWKSSVAHGMHATGLNQSG